jgi:hypothetical protein
LSALILFLSTVVYFPHALMIVAALMMGLRNGLFERVGFGFKTWTKSQIWNAIVICLILLLSFINWLWSFDPSLGISANITSFLLLPFTLLAGVSFTRGDAKILLALIALECLVGCYEFSMGIRSIIPSINAATTPIIDEGLWYSSRVYGLSSNSSVLALKVFAGLLLIHFYEFKGFKTRVIEILFVLGVVVTFNRTVIVTLVLMYCLSFILNALEKRSNERRNLARIVLLTLGIIAAFVLIFFYFDSLLFQFTRDKGVDLSGRDEIWAFFAEFIFNNLWLGNGTVKLLTEEGKHAHNSFLQLIASNGIAIALGYFVLIVSNINRKNLVLLIALVVYSSTQYGIFWGISLLDILLYLFLFQSSKMLKTNKNLSPLRFPVEQVGKGA